MEPSHIDIRIGDSLVVRLDKGMSGEVIVNGVAIPHVTRLKFDFDWNSDSLLKAEADIDAGPLVATVEYLVDPRITSPQ